MALIDDFKARFPAAFATSVVDTWLPILEPVYPAYYAVAYSAASKECTLNLIAHMLVMETQTGSAPSRDISGKSVGSVSTSYAARSGPGSDLRDWLSSTKYGQRFLLLSSFRYGGMTV
jgi:hypothetical protein